MLRTIVNAFGILANIVGAWMVYKNSPLNFDVIDAGGAASNWVAQVKATKKKNNKVKKGVYILLAGSLIQLIANFIP